MLTTDVVGTTRRRRKPALREELRIFGFGALLPSWEDQHHEVLQLALVRRIAFGQDGLDDQQPAVGPIARRQWPRMVRHCSSLQSWMMCDST